MWAWAAWTAWSIITVWLCALNRAGPQPGHGAGLCPVVDMNTTVDNILLDVD